MRWGAVAGCVSLIVFLIAAPLAAQVSFDVALEGDLDRMKAMVVEDPSLVDVRSENGKTVLHYAAQGGHTELVAYLIQAGARIDSPNDAGETPLHYAAAMGHEDVVRILLGHDASAVVLDTGSNTPLHYAAYSGSVEIARMLIGKGADVNAADFYGYKPLDLATRNEQQELSELLEKEGGTRIVIEDPEVVQVSGPIYRVRFPFGDVSNIGLSAGEDGFLLVDTGFSSRAIGKLREAMSSLGDGELKMIINTHLHPDHIAGNSIGGDGVTIIDFNNLEEMVADGVLAPGGGPIEGRSGKSFPAFYTMRFNGEEIRLIPYPGIHTDADLLVYFTRSGVVHMGDLLILQSFPSVTRRAEDYLDFLETVVDVFPESTRFICGHGREGTIADVAEYHRGLSAAAEIIKSSLAQGKTKQTILEEPALQHFESWGEFIPILNTEYWFNAVAADVKDQTDSTEVSGTWLGQEPPGMQPEVFLPEVLSHGERGVCSGFLDNGTVFVFKQLSPKTDWKYEPIYFIEFENGQWTDPVVAPFSDLYPYNFTVAPDGKALYFASLRSADDHSVILPKADVWKVEKTADGWSEPETFGAPVNSEDHFENYPSITSDGTLYFMSWRDEGFGKDDIYRLRLVGGEYTELENIGGPVNTENSEVDPFIGADESYLIYCSKTLGGHGGYDLYISFRTQDGSWSPPVNMGEEINSAGAEFRPSVTPDGKYFFFTSDRSGAGENYWVDAGIIDSLRPPAK